MTDTTTTEQQLAKCQQELYPASEEEATAERMIAFCTAVASLHYEWVAPHAVSLREVEPGTGDELHQRLDIRTVTAMQGWFQTSYLLQALQEHAPEHADEMATDIWLMMQSGDTYGEFLWQWSITRDIPVPADTLDGRTVEECKAEQLEFERRASERKAIAQAERAGQSIDALKVAASRA